jgi:hypothetical protein
MAVRLDDWSVLWIINSEIEPSIKVDVVVILKAPSVNWLNVIAPVSSELVPAALELTN